MRKLILLYFRYFPIDHFKNLFEKFVEMSRDIVLYTTPSGIKYKLNLKDHVMRQIYLKGVYERNTFRHLSKLITPSDTFVDVGANIGAYSVGLSPFIKNGKIISFEPNPRALHYLEENIKLNDIKNITVNKVGLSDRDEDAILFTSSLTTASINKNKESVQKECISLITLDKYCEENDINNIDVLKVDVEGHEVKCIKGAIEIIKKSKSMVLVMEIDDNCLNAGSSKQEVFEFIRSLDFKAYAPRGFPFGLREIKSIPENYADNIIFKKQLGKSNLLNPQTN
ncbi:MAG: FkbM family methyltransferase [Rhodothermales bacterium]